MGFTMHLKVFSCLLPFT